TKLCLISGALSLIGSLWLYFHSFNIYFALLPLLLPPLVLALGLYLPYVSVQSRRAQVETELPLFSALASVMAVSGLSLIRSFDLALESGLFPAISREAALLKRNTTYFNRSPLEALEELAHDHPSESFRQWIFGYTSILRSGGDVAAYLISKTKSFLKSLERRWVAYANTANTLSEAVLALFLICPLSIALTSLVFASELGVIINNLYSFVVLPLVAALSATIIHYIQPKTLNSYALNKYALLSAAVAAATLAALSSLRVLEPHEVLLASLASSSLPLAVVSYGLVKEIDQAEKALPDFLREVTEQVKLGLDINESVRRALQRSYSKGLDKALIYIRNRMLMGSSLEEAVRGLKSPSWLVKSSLLILAQASEGGLASPLALEILTDYIHDYCSAKLSGRSNVKLQLFVGYAAPAFMVAGTTLLRALASQVAQPLAVDHSAEALLMFNQSLAAEVLSSIMSMAVLTSFIIGLLISKVYDLTFLSFRHTLICLLVAAISMKLSPLLLK
ncbi:MAG: type II secretion system F family protein, partial [Candidatus Nezhaarchaeales archaeon]